MSKHMLAMMHFIQGLSGTARFLQHEKDNESTKGTTIQTPVLYLRGEHEYGKIDDYVTSFRESGLVNIQGQLIPTSGHYASEKAPEDVVKALKAFVSGQNR